MPPVIGGDVGAFQLHLQRSEILVQHISGITLAILAFEMAVIEIAEVFAAFECTGFLRGIVGGAERAFEVGLQAVGAELASFPLGLLVEIARPAKDRRAGALRVEPEGRLVFILIVFRLDARAPGKSKRRLPGFRRLPFAPVLVERAAETRKAAGPAFRRGLLIGQPPETLWRQLAEMTLGRTAVVRLLKRGIQRLPDRGRGVIRLLLLAAAEGRLAQPHQAARPASPGIFAGRRVGLGLIVVVSVGSVQGLETRIGASENFDAFVDL